MVTSKERADIDRFEGDGDFALWKVRMLAHFGVLGLKSILTDEKLLKEGSDAKDEPGSAMKDSGKGLAGIVDPAPAIDPAKFEKSEKAKDLIVLNVGNKVLRKIQHCETAAAMWSTLNNLYTETSLPNMIYLQLRFYTFKMVDSKSIDENVDDFLKLVADLNNLQVEVSEEVQAILLLSSLPAKYDQLKETLKYGRDTLSLTEVTGAAKSKERELIESGKFTRSGGEGLLVDRGRSEQRSGKGNGKTYKGRSQSRHGRSKSRSRNNKNTKGCFVCGKEGHWKRDWHSRLGHMSLNNMSELVKRGFIVDKDVKTLDLCEHCIIGKSHKQSFPKAKHVTNGILEYVHSDLWGFPSTPDSLAGAKYFVTFIDDFSKKVWIYFLKTKDEVFAKFREWKAEVETKTEKKVKCLRTDNGLEFCNKQFDDYCKKARIKRHITCTYTPQQNGVSERMNRTIMDKVRCMLAESGLDQSFWAEAASTAIYLINRSPNSTLEFKMPEEVWLGYKPNLGHLRTFGCTAYVHITEEKTGPRAIKGVFVGYPMGTKGYRVWIEEEGRCRTSRNVVFNEDELYKHTVTKGKESTEVTKKEKRAKKKVSFSDDLIRGPSPSIESEGTSDQGGEESSSSSNSSSDEEQDHGVDSERDHESESGDTETLDTYVLARDRERRQNVRPPSRYEDGNFVCAQCD
ncbi:hypothetical protein YC2023_083646 [Brassica napus]